MTGIELISSERDRQKTIGWTERHDSLNHTNGELATFAALYALSPRDRVVPIWDKTIKDLLLPKGFDFRGNTNRIRELQKAGALIAAEIDRLIADENRG